MKIALLIFAVLSLLAFVLYGADKRKAKRKEWRIPEKTLLLTSFLGGALGGLAAMQLFRHKTKHLKFKISVPIFAVFHIGLILIICFSGNI